MRRIAVAFMAALVPVSPSIGAQELRVAGADCSRPVHFVANDLPLSTVLKALSESLHFIVTYHSQTDPPVTIDARAPATDLVRRIARDMNFSLEEVADARCLRGRRIVKLSVLPDAPGGSRATVALERRASQTRETERIARFGQSDYLRNRGVTDQPIEELDAH